MTDSALDNARRQRELLGNQINEAQQNLEIWRRQIVRVDQFISDYDAFSKDTFPSDLIDQQENSSTGSFDSKPKLRAGGNSSKEEVASAARRYIKNVGRPVPREELRDALIQQGLTIDGADPYNVLNTMLFRTREESKVFLIRNVGYWLSDLDLRKAGEMPERQSDENEVPDATLSDELLQDEGDDQDQDDDEDDDELGIFA